METITITITITSQNVAALNSLLLEGIGKIDELNETISLLHRMNDLLKEENATLSKSVSIVQGYIRDLEASKKDVEERISLAGGV